MTVPDYEAMMLPMLKLAAAQPEARIQELTEALADHFQLSDADRASLLPSGKTPVVRSRAGWARTYLVQAGLLEPVRRGVVRISSRGHAVLRQNPLTVDNAFLLQFDEFKDFRGRSRQEAKLPSDPAGTTVHPEPALTSAGTPDDQIEGALAIIEVRLREELMARLLAGRPAFFEQVVVDLLVAMGYGSSVEDAGEAIGRTGDGGVDGVIREDRLGLDLIYVQAKRYANASVAVDEIRSFAGALDDKGARKGVFITTSRFTAESEKFVSRQQMKRLVLIDGERLTRLMLRHDVGVRADRVITVKRIDTDYFEPDDAA